MLLVSPLGTKTHFHVNTWKRILLYWLPWHGRLVTWLQTSNIPDNGNFEVASETGSVLCRIALWDLFREQSWTPYPA